eukprot:1338926-Pleurochrysis_carterae.AAC.1
MILRQEPASSPTMNRVLQRDVPGHSSEYHRRRTSCTGLTKKDLERNEPKRSEARHKGGDKER